MVLSGLMGKPGESLNPCDDILEPGPADSKTLSYATIEAFYTFIRGRFSCHIIS